jgi:phosphoadenosine phosphosulfate reductase
MPALLSPKFNKPLQLPLSKNDIDTINIYLSSLSPQDILKWALEYLPGLYQTTAFGLTGLVIIDMISKITNTTATTSSSSSSPPPLIFIDTLYHFPETYELVEEVKSKYQVQLYVYKPDGCSSTKDFEEKHGVKFWETDEDSYDFFVKVINCFHLDSRLAYSPFIYFR